MKEKLLGKNPEELAAIVRQYGLRSFAAGQIARWLYSRRVSSIDEMTDLPLAARAALSERFEVGRTSYGEALTSVDGTRKYLFPTVKDGKWIETVMIPEYEDGGEVSRATVCVSSQIGCRMGCRFCMTGRGGFHGNLDAAEIISQFFSIDESASLTNAVFMGMGEPLDNWDNVSRVLEILTAPWGLAWSPKRITLSSVGVLPKLETYLKESRCHLAISLHNPFAAERGEMMPAQKAWPLEDIVQMLRKYDFTGQRRVSFEYIMFAGWNDTPRHAAELVRLLRPLECRINLIRFHSIPDFPLKPSTAPAIEVFKKRLNDAGITTTLRASRGEDVMAACGLLAGRGLHKGDK